MQSPVRAELVEGSPEQAEGHERVTAFGWEFSVHPSTSSTTRVVPLKGVYGYGQTNGKFNREVIYDPILMYSTHRRSRRPLLHRLVSRAVYFNPAALGRGDPAQGNVMVLPGLIFLQLEGIGALHMIDSSELPLLGANDGHIRFNLVGVNHGVLLLALPKL
jgi:hypothetical protein